MARHGGGAFSGKDPSKVDRSAAYAARWVAKHVVASGASERCEVQVAYAIGVARPVSVLVETFGTERVDRQKIAKAVDAIFDLAPPPSFATSTCAVRSISARPRTGTSGAATRASPGSRHLVSTTYAGNCRSVSGARSSRHHRGRRGRSTVRLSPRWHDQQRGAR